MTNKERREKRQKPQISLLQMMKTFILETDDIPPDAVAYGVPGRIVCRAGEKDEKFYWKDKELDVWE